MKKTKKFLLTALICLTAIFSALGFSSCDFFNEVFLWENDGVLYYELNADKQSYSVVGVSDKSTVEIIIPSFFKGKPITSIGYEAFNSCDSLTSIEIPDSVQSIGNRSFRCCDGLTSIKIPDSVQSIGYGAFYWCEGLTSVVIPDSVQSIGYEAFYNCDSLTSVVIPDSVQSIGYEAFWNCDSLTNITVDENNQYYKSIDGNLYTKDGKTLIQYAIGKTDTSFAIPDNVQSIGGSAFYNCIRLTSVAIPDSVQSIGWDVFAHCINLKSVVIPDGVQSIDSNTFSSCISLTSVVIPDSVQSIGDSAFYNCDSLTSVFITDIAAWCNIDFENSVSNPLYYADNLYLNGELVTNLVIPDNVTEIKGYAFYNCDNLTSVEIPDSVQSIGNCAFEGCYKLVEVYNKSALDIVQRSTAYGYVGYCAKNVYTPTSGQSKLSTDENGYIIYTDGDNKILIGYTGIETDLILPEEITEIYKYAFFNCDQLKNVVIGDRVQSIGYGTFYNCSSMTSITFKDISTWYRTTSEINWKNKKGGTQIDVTNASKNVTHFQNGYEDYYWYKL